MKINLAELQTAFDLWWGNYCVGEFSPDWPQTVSAAFEEGYKSAAGKLLQHVREIPHSDTDTLRTLRAIINGKLSRRTISPEQQEKMQEARNGRKVT